MPDASIAEAWVLWMFEFMRQCRTERQDPAWRTGKKAGRKVS